MSEIWLRLAGVVGAAAVGLAWAWVARRRAATRPRKVRMPGLGPGVFLFTSETCESCTPAREAVARHLGSDGFREIVWEQEPAMFDRYAVARVPTVVRLDAEGNGVAFEGVPDRTTLDRIGGP